LIGIYRIGKEMDRIYKKICIVNVFCAVCFIVIMAVNGVICWGIYTTLTNAESAKFVSKSTYYGNEFVKEFNSTINLISYNVDRSHAYAEITGKYISQENYTNIYQYDKYPYSDRVNIFLWLPIIYESEKQDYLKFARENIYFNFSILDGVEVGGNLTISTTANDSVYAPLSCMTPYISSITYGLGLDFLTDNISFLPTTDQFTVTDRLNITWLPDKNFTVALMKEAPSIGYTLVVIDPSEIASAVFQEIGLTDEGDINIQINDTTASNKSLELLYQQEGFTTDVESLYINEIVVHFFNKNWTITTIYTDPYIATVRTSDPIIYMVIAIIALVLLDIIFYIMYVYYLNIQRERIQAKVGWNTANQMLGYVNHELRNPLNVIIGTIDISTMELHSLSEKLKSNSMKQKIGIIVSNLDNAYQNGMLMTHIVNDILDIRKIEEGKLVIENKPILMSKLIKDIERTISMKVQEKPDIRYIIEYRNIDIDTFEFMADEYRIKQVIINYLSNAFKFTFRGSITLLVERIDNELKFSVIDTGIGITEDNKQKIFKPFIQTSAEHSSRYGGIGLGLYLNQLIVRNLKGSIGFESDLGYGSTFWFKILYCDSIVRNVENIQEAV
jgi:signal transduction histidine kinase